MAVDYDRANFQALVQGLIVAEQEAKTEKAKAEHRIALLTEEYGKALFVEQQAKAKKAESEARTAEAIEEHVKRKIREDGDLTKLPKWGS